MSPASSNCLSRTSLESMTIKLLALDADDTLWHNEPIYQNTQKRFRDLLFEYHDPAWVEARLNETEIRNLTHFGYGVKGFVLSMIETAIELSEGRVSAHEIQNIIDMGREMLVEPIELLPGVGDAVKRLGESHSLMLITKGDLLDQESKLARSGLGEHFHAIEIVSEKDPATYTDILARREVSPAEFMMVGNSIRSDILPVIEIGGQAVHIPYATTWVHERVDPETLNEVPFHRLERLEHLPDWLAMRR